MILNYGCSIKGDNNKQENYKFQKLNFTLTDSITQNLNLQEGKLYTITVEKNKKEFDLLLMDSSNEIVNNYGFSNSFRQTDDFYFFCEKTDNYVLKLGENENEIRDTVVLSMVQNSNEINVSLSQKEYLEDFQLFRQIFENTNSGIYRYRSSESVDSVMNDVLGKIDNQTSFQDFYDLVWSVIDYTGSLHNELSYSRRMDILLKKQKIFFPIPIKWVAETLYSNATIGEIPVGAKILTINGVKSSDFAKKAGIYRSTDGFNTTGKYHFLQTKWLPYLVYLAYGSQDQFEIVFNVEGKTKRTQIESITYEQFQGNFDNRHSKSYDPKKKSIKYEFEYIDSLKTNLLTIRSFGIGRGEYDKYHAFLDSVFQIVKEKEKLIVDIRGNSGGTGDALMLLTSYLTERTVKENLKAYTIFNKLPYTEYFVGQPELFQEGLTNYVNEYVNGKYLQREKYNPPWEPNEKAYHGSFILLIDPGVASAASHFAAHIKSDKKATIIGEESAGAYYGHTGHVPVQYELPNSKLILIFSIIDLDQDVRQLPDQNHGDGIKPDIEVTQSYEDFIQNIDTQLNYALKVK
jgi:hypothetical protein